MYIRLRTINGKIIGLHDTNDLDSLTKEELIELVEELVQELDKLESN